MNKKPLIAIVGKPEDTEKRFNYIRVNNELKNRILLNGGLPIGILPLDNKYKLQGEGNKYELDTKDYNNYCEVLNKIDGVILQGGYVSNTYEEEIIKICLNNDIPILCICSGFNNMVRALGGSLYLQSENIHNYYDAEYVHSVKIYKESKLYNILGKELCDVNSIHVWVADENTVKNCKIMAVCPIDGTVEALEVPDKKFAVGIKWHPEILPEMNVIFESFVKNCF